MGEEKEKEKRKKAFKKFRIDDKILNMAKTDAIVMHCLPAHRGEEITSSVIDGKSSVFLNRLRIVYIQQKRFLHIFLKKVERWKKN